MNKWVLLIMVVTVVIGCANNKITGRKQLNIISNAQMISLAETEYAEVLKKSKVVTNTKASATVANIGKQIVEAVYK